MTVLAPLYAHDPARTALAIGDFTIDYGRLCADIDTMAAWLAGKGLKPGQRISIFAREQSNPNYWDWIMVLGAIRAGLVHSINALPPAVRDSGAAGPLAAALGRPRAVAKCLGDPLELPFEPAGTAPLAEQLEPGGKVPPLKAADRAVRLFRTSGTTGTPKVVPWDDRLMGQRLAEVRATSGIVPETRLLCGLGMITTTSLRHTLGGCQIGCQVMLHTIGDHSASPWDPVIASDHIATSPFRLGRLLGNISSPLPGRETRTIELLGGRIQPELRRKALERICSELRNLYGSTEAGMVASGKAGLIGRHPGAVGFAVPGAEIEIVDEDGHPLPAGKQGIVRVRTQSMADGYIGIDEPLQRDGWFYPGDLGVLAEDGMFAVAGRAGDTINVGGAMLAVADIEAKIRELPLIEEVCVLDHPNNRTDAVMVAVTCPKGTDLNQLALSCRSFFPTGFRIEVCRVENMPRNEMGKIVRRDLAARIARAFEERRRATEQA